MAYTTYTDRRGLYVRLSFCTSYRNPEIGSYNEAICGSFISLIYQSHLSVSFITYQLPRKHLSSKAGSNWLKNFSDFDGNRKLFAVLCHVYSSPRHCGIWKQLDQVHTLTPHFFNINLNNILLLRLGSFSWFSNKVLRALSPPPLVINVLCNDAGRNFCQLYFMFV
jgi:hypothetical protein